MAATPSRGQSAALVWDFIKELKGLMGILVEREPNDPQVLRVQKRLGVVSDMTPMLVVEWTGEALFRHHESIYSEDPKEWAQFFDPGVGTKKFQDQLQATASDDNRSQAEHLILRVQKQLREMEAAERQFYITKVRGLLDKYLDIRAHSGE